MHMRLSAITLAVIGGAASLAMPATASAGNVGYYKGCSLSGNGNASQVVVAAGHTLVPVATLDAASLTGLDGLIITACYGSYTGSSAVDSAVHNGMKLLFERLDWSGGIQLDTSTLPGDPTFGSAAQQVRPLFGDLVDIAPGAPTAITSGPGGVLGNNSLDYVSGPTWYNLVAAYNVSTLPSGAIPFLTTPDPQLAGSFAYPHGAGWVVYTDSQFTIQLPGGYADVIGYNNWRDAGFSFLTNALAWLLAQDPAEATTCASSGYTGTKLNWCRIICESESSSSTIDTYLRRWINKYRDLPYCAVEGGGEEPPPSQG